MELKKKQLVETYFEKKQGNILFILYGLNNYNCLSIVKENKEIFRANIDNEKSEDIKNYINNIFKNEENIKIENLYKMIQKDLRDCFLSFYADNKEIYEVKPQKQQNQNYYNKNNNKINYEEENQVVNNLPICHVIHILLDNKVLVLHKIEKNGKFEDFYKLSSAKNSSKMFKISVLNEQSYENNKNLQKKRYFSDVYGEKSGAGVFNFIKYLYENDVLDLPNFVDKNDPKSISSGIYSYIRHNIVKNLNKENYNYEVKKIENNFGRGSSCPPRIPFKKQTSQDIINHLIKNRYIDKEIVEREVKKGNIWTGNYQNPENNKFINNQHFFKLVNDKGYVQANERLTLYNGKMSKKNLTNSNLKGSSYEIKGNQKHKKATFFSEATIDAMSTENIFALRGYNPDDYNFYSIQGTPHFPSWIEKRAGIRIYFKESEQEEKGTLASFIETEKKELKEITKEHVENFKNETFKNKIYIIDTLDNKKITQYYEALKNSVIGKELGIEIIESKNKRNFYLENIKKEENYIIDKTNIFPFLNENNLLIKDGKVLFQEEEEKEILIDFNNKEHMERAKTKIQQAINAEGFGMAFDNDYDGLKNIKTLQSMFKSIEVPFHVIIPPKINIDNGKEAKDNNDILQYLKKEKDDDKKHDVIMEYFSTYENESLLEDKYDIYLKNALEEKKKKNQLLKKKR